MDRKFNMENAYINNIETEDQFWLFLEDSKNYFNGIHITIDEDTTDQEAIDFCKKYNFLNFNELLEKDGRNLSDKLLNNEHVKNLIKRFNNLVSRIKVFKTKEELIQIIQEFDEFFGRFNLQSDSLNKENKTDDFTERINDMKGQINSIKVLLSMDRPIEDFKEVQKSLKNFNETVESFGNKIPETILNDHKNQEKIKFYDEVIEKLKKAQTIEELNSILENY